MPCLVREMISLRAREDEKKYAVEKISKLERQVLPGIRSLLAQPANSAEMDPYVLLIAQIEAIFSSGDGEEGSNAMKAILEGGALSQMITARTADPIKVMGRLLELYDEQGGGWLMTQQMTSMIQTFYETDLDLDVSQGDIHKEVEAVFNALNLHKGRGMVFGDILLALGRNRLGHKRLSDECRAGLRQLGAAMVGQSQVESAYQSGESQDGGRSQDLELKLREAQAETEELRKQLSQQADVIAALQGGDSD